MPLLIDLSNNNGEPDFAKVKAYGVVGCYLKASEGTSFVDKTFQTRRANATRAGLHVGAYHFARPDESAAKTQAERFCTIVRKLALSDLRPALDMEAQSKLTPSALTEWAREFDQEVRRLLGVLPLFYSYGPYIEHMHPATPIGAGLWLAAYGKDDGVEHPFTVPAPWKKAVLHQFTDRGHVAGTAGVVDVSHAASMTPLYAHPVRRAITAPLKYLGKH